MGEFYIFGLIFPIIFMLTLSFIFSSQVFAIKAYQFIANCPMPLWDIRASHISITSSNTVAYNQAYLSGSGNDTEAIFQCTYDLTSNPPTIGVSYGEKYYSASAFGFPYGFIVFTGDSLSQWFTKAWAGMTSAWLFINAPAQVSGLSFWVYINIFLFGLMIFSGVMLFRGVG